MFLLVIMLINRVWKTVFLLIIMTNLLRQTTLQSNYNFKKRSFIWFIHISLFAVFKAARSNSNFRFKKMFIKSIDCLVVNKMKWKSIDLKASLACLFHHSISFNNAVIFKLTGSIEFTSVTVISQDYVKKK